MEKQFYNTFTILDLADDQPEDPLLKEAYKIVKASNNISITDCLAYFQILLDVHDNQQISVSKQLFGKSSLIYLYAGIRLNLHKLVYATLQARSRNEDCFKHKTWWIVSDPLFNISITVQKKKN